MSFRKLLRLARPDPILLIGGGVMVVRSVRDWFRRTPHLLTLLSFSRPSFDAKSLQTEGASNADVWRFQRLFQVRAARRGIRLEVTGVYDGQTRSAVRAYQKLVLPMIGVPDGFVGPLTARKLHIRLTGDQ